MCSWFYSVFTQRPFWLKRHEWSCVHGIYVRCISLHAASTIWCRIKSQLHFKKVISPEYNSNFQIKDILNVSSKSFNKVRYIHTIGAWCFHERIVYVLIQIYSTVCFFDHEIFEFVKRNTFFLLKETIKEAVLSAWKGTRSMSLCCLILHMIIEAYSRARSLLT